MSGLLADDTRIPEKNTDLVQITDKLDHIAIPIHLAMSGTRTHNSIGDRH